ncbi:MAG: hypothetical protein ACLPYZ_03520 [Limisphaerales bacterium]
MREGYVNLTVADHDLFDECFDDLPLVLGRQGRPTVREAAKMFEAAGVAWPERSITN